jgi:hypothetical protein
MTGEEWLTRETLFGACPSSPLSCLREPGSDRRMFLFLAAYLPRFVFDQFCPACLNMFPLFSRHAEEPLAGNDWAEALREYHPRVGECATRPVFRFAIQYLRGIICPAEFWNGLFQTHSDVGYGMHGRHRGDADRRWFEALVAESDRVSREGMSLLKDIIGNPYRPISLALEWRTDNALALAGLMYESRNFAAMPILADALQDAGCDNADVLDHCRGPGPHVRGCWAVDLVLGKA